MRLVFDAPPHHALREGGDLIPGGGEFTVSDDRGNELLADPYVPVRPAGGPAPGLVGLTRPELDQLAREAGLDPALYPNKRAIADALASTPAGNSLEKE